jgi:hypothetical protein
MLNQPHYVLSSRRSSSHQQLVSAGNIPEL